MSKLYTIYDKLSEDQRLEFLAACASKQRGLFGVPRIAIKNNDQISAEVIKNFLLKPIDDFVKSDTKFYKIINGDNIDNFIEYQNIKIIFDTCKVRFDKEDELFDLSPENIKKMFNLNIRNSEKKKFLSSNFEHFKDEEFISSVVLLKKLNDIWVSKWGQKESYQDIYYHQIIGNIN